MTSFFRKRGFNRDTGGDSPDERQWKIPLSKIVYPNGGTAYEKGFERDVP